MARLLQIAQLGCEVLREIAKEVQIANDPCLLSLQEDMIATMEDGLGIAAPQVYVSKRCFILSSRPGPNRESAPLIEPILIINPEILWMSEEKMKSWEGCLSIPGIRALVPRHKIVKVRYSTSENSVVERELSDFPARVFQHEYDHLDGLVYLDRVESSRAIITEKEYQKMIGKTS